MTIGRGGGFTGTAVALSSAQEAGRAGIALTQEAARIGEARAENRRQTYNFAAKEARLSLPIDDHLPAHQVPMHRARMAPNQGMALPFLAQHIAQEIMPDTAGVDSHASAAQAYIGARDFNAEILPQGSGFNILV